MSYGSRYGQRPAHPSHRRYVPLAQRTPSPAERMAGHSGPSPASATPAIDRVTPHLATSVFALDPVVSQLVDVIAEAKHAIYQRLDARERQLYTELPDDERGALRANAIADVMHMFPWIRAAIYVSGSRQFANLAPAVEAYREALLLNAPRRPMVTASAEPADDGDRWAAL